MSRRALHRIVTKLEAQRLDPPDPIERNVTCRVCEMEVWYEDAHPDDPTDWDSSTWRCDLCRDAGLA